ncbi:hypothetical protein MYX82_03170 [Acidobacteria bacterium AH-259-D05]|nr:hypothetical protein [Acidobacteria bacterium AH-259-D05]
MSNLYAGMSNAKREEFRRRIIKSDNISPVLMEIDMAAHFWQMGFDLEWAESKSQGQKIPEFVCISETLSYDVECKTKTVDAGRMIAWPRFYRLADLVVEQLRARNLHGDVRIVTPDRLPSDTKWQASVVDAIAKQSPGPSKELVLDDETLITTSLMVKDTVIPMQEINSHIASVQKQFTHVIFHSTERAGTECVNPIIVCAESKRSDAFLKSVLEDLREAKRQLSGKRAGIIVCFVPEAQSFRKASNESALRKLTEGFFENHAPDSLHGVTFIADRQTATFANNVETLYPSITFHNSRYARKWGVATEYMAHSF